MENISNIISLNVYEPELNLKYYKKPKKKSIITKIIKNVEIGNAKSQINKKYNDINKNSINLYEYNIFQKPGDKTFRKKIKNKENCFGNFDIINKSDKQTKHYKIIKNQNTFLDRKKLKKLNKNIPNNLYDYLHPYEYMNFTKKNDCFDKKLTKKKEGKDLKKENELKNIKLDNDFESNQYIDYSKNESKNLSLYYNNSKSETNKRFALSTKLIKNNNKSQKNFINKKIIKDIIKKTNINNTNNIKKMKINKKSFKFCDEKSSSSSSLENLNNNYITSQSNFIKRLNKKSIESSNLNHHNTFSSRNLNYKKPKKDKYIIKRCIKTARYNQKVFNRINNILVPFEEIKKKVFNSDSERLYQQLKKSQNLFKLTENIITTKNFTKDKKKSMINEINQLNTDLNEIKFYILSDKINKGKYIDKFDDIEKKMKHGEDKELLIKDILFDKLNNSNNENDYINNYVNKNQYVSKLISSYINFNEKKKKEAF